MVAYPSGGRELGLFGASGPVRPSPGVAPGLDPSRVTWGPILGFPGVDPLLPALPWGLAVDPGVEPGDPLGRPVRPGRGPSVSVTG